MQLPSLIARHLLKELAETARMVQAEGCFVEVGVYKGGSAQQLDAVARERGRALWLFDTFTGEPWSDTGKGDLHKAGEFGDVDLDALCKALPDAKFVVGRFPKTLKEADARGMGQIALAHIDCDQYRSVKACCDFLAKRMAPGGLMIFDDYHSLNGAKRAVEESFPGHVETSPQGVARVRFP